MGFRFQKRIKLLPGVSVNLSKSGVSTSLGPRGAKVTFGHGQRRTTVGLPGSGLSHTTVKRTAAAVPGDGGDTLVGWVVVALFVAAVIGAWVFA